MDLKRKLGLGSDSRQSYELIRSTQSLVDRLNLDTEDITIQPVHPSIMGQDNWFAITYNSSNTTRYFSCQNSRERDEWITSLRRTLSPATEDRRRTENSLKMCVFEVKGLPDKKKYFCEIHVDDKIYARTSSKKMQGMCFWGEHFTFTELPKKVEKISLLIYKDRGIRRRRNPVGRVKICVSSVQSRREVEKWYPLEKSRREAPSIRLKCQFQSIDILPLRDYEELSKWLRDDYKSLCKMLEPNINVKVKDELSSSLMAVFHIQDVAEDILADIVVQEISSNENTSLTFRANTIPTKAMEAYIRLVGQKYLEDTLRSTLQDILAKDLDLEIDPVKVASAEVLSQHRAELRSVVTLIWRRIANSHSIFPVRLQRCFHKIRQYLEQVDRGEVAPKLVSSCLFLRYLCPAILGPNLFSLTEEFPGEKANRNLTLIAKTLQTLANFARYEGKENSMEFINSWLDEESGNMRKFLDLVSGPPPEDWIHGLGEQRGALGRHLSSLHTVLVENVGKVPASQEEGSGLERLRTILNDISNNLHRPSTSILESIAEPTPLKIQRISVEDGTKMTPISSGNNNNNNKNSGGGGISNWMSWTLGRDKRKGSHPIPQHELRHGGLWARGQASSTTESSSSSASLTPSPHDQARLWPGGRGKAHSRSSVSVLEDSEDSESGSGSFWPASAAGHTYSTLPRPRPPESRSLSEYEREITGLRSAMETLQVKLHDAERKLSLSSSASSQSPRQSPSKDDPVTVTGPRLTQRPDEEVRGLVTRLMAEEDILRRDQMEMTSNLGDKEMMILLQQRKIAALDEANNRLLGELSRLGDRVGYSRAGVQASKRSVQETPKTVDELLDTLDSFSDTRV